MKLARVIFLFISIGFISQVSAQTVYTTKTGEKYHKDNCRFLKYSKTKTTIKKARSLGYLACKICKPTESNTNSSGNTVSAINPKKNNTTPNSSPKKAIATRCTGKTKKGLRCKRKTKNSNGRCYQH